MRDYLPLLNVLGRLLMIFSAAYLAPIAVSVASDDGTASHFFLAMLVHFALGLLLAFVAQRQHREMKIRDGFLLVTLAWTCTAALTGLPLLLAYPGMSFTDSFFEMTSAMTTTGATVMTDLDHAPLAINFWRHWLQWFGGLGIIVLAVAILPLLGVGGMQLFKAETPGPMKDARLTSRINDTARALWLVYLALTLCCMLSLRVAGMSWFDAVCHAFSAMALGGFSTRDASVSAFNSPMVELVLIVFMMLAGINFATHFLAWRDRSMRAYLIDAEARAFYAVVLLSCVGIAVFLYARGVYPDFPTALRHSSFNTVSLATTSGYMSVDYDKWPLFASMWMLLMSGYASCAGSTGGGIKMVRGIVLVKTGARELHKLLHPQGVETIKVGSAPVSDRIVIAVLSFACLYTLTALISTALLIASGMDFLSAFTGMVACINNAGPGLGSVGPSRNYASMTDFQTWVLSITMLLGRLEVLSVVVVFMPAFWRR